MLLILLLSWISKAHVDGDSLHSGNQPWLLMFLREVLIKTVGGDASCLVSA